MPKPKISLELTSAQAAILQRLLDSGTDGIVTFRDAKGGKITLGHVAMNSTLSHVAMNAVLSHVAMNAVLSKAGRRAAKGPTK